MEKNPETTGKGGIKPRTFDGETCGQIWTSCRKYWIDHKQKSLLVLTLRGMVLKILPTIPEDKQKVYNTVEWALEIIFASSLPQPTKHQTAR